MTLQLENGKKIVIWASDNSAANRYVNSVSVDGKPYSKNWLSHTALMKGALIDFSMSPEPNLQRGTRQEDVPYSFSGQR